MTTYKRICIHDAIIEAKNGDRQEIKRGEEYITSPTDDRDMVTVYSTFWVEVHKSYFAGEVLFTK